MELNLARGQKHIFFAPAFPDESVPQGEFDESSRDEETLTS